MIEIKELRIDPLDVQAYVDGESANLTATEFRLLYALAREEGRVVSREELMQRIWGRRQRHRDRTVDVFVRKLRDKIDRRAPAHTFIHTRHGVGYKLQAAPKQSPPRTDPPRRRHVVPPTQGQAAATRYINRELSWLDFNGRVLELAADSSVPLLERIKFCSIFSANLDEFFMVRVAGLEGQASSGCRCGRPTGARRQRRSTRFASAPRSSPRSRHGSGPASCGRGSRRRHRRRRRRGLHGQGATRS